MWFVFADDIQFGKQRGLIAGVNSDGHTLGAPLFYFLILCFAFFPFLVSDIGLNPSSRTWSGGSCADVFAKRIREHEPAGSRI